MIIFLIIHMIPGDPIVAMFGKSQNKELIESVRKAYALDQPIYKQYIIWVGNILHLNFGKSIISDLPVFNLVMERLNRTIVLALSGMFVSFIVSIPFGLISAYKHNTFIDFSLTSFVLLLISIPEFWVGVILILFFSVFLGILPSSGYVFPNQDFFGFIKILILPVVCIGFAQVAISARMIRTTMIETLQEDYIRLVKAYGISELRILSIHAFRNALIPVITVVGAEFGYLLGGAVVIERVFNYPGLGSFMFDAIAHRDYPVIQGAILVFSLLFILVNLLVDVLYAFINPKIRY